MRRKTIVVSTVAIALIALGLFVAARSLLGSDLVRASIERQLAAYLHQPVRVRAATTSILPRLAVNLHDVTIGEPVSVTLARIDVVTGLRGLFSRTIEDAEIIVDGGRVSLPLPFQLFASAAGVSSPAAAASSFTVLSVRRIALRQLTLVAAGRTLEIDLESSLDGDRLAITRLAARGAATRLAASGALTSVSRTEGTLDAKADAIDVDELMAMATALTANPSPETAGRVRDFHVTVRLAAAAGRFAGYAFTDLKTDADLREGRLGLAPLSLRLFDGRFQGRLDATTGGAAPQLRLSGRIDAIDVTELTKGGALAGALTGRLGGTITASAAGTDAAALLRTARGTIAAAIADGTIPGLDLVRTVVLKFGKPSGAPPPGSGSAFSRLRGTFALAGGTLASDDIALESRDVDVQGSASLDLISGEVHARGDVVLSEELTAQAGVDLRRYARHEGRVIVPCTVDGPLAHPRLFLDVVAATRRALQNELQRRASSWLRGLFKKKG